MPDSELDRLRLLYREEMEPGSAACPSEEDLASLLLGALDGPTRQELADHVIGCRQCAKSFRLLRELHLEAGAKPQVATRRRWPIWAAAAVVGLLAVGLPLYYFGALDLTPTRDRDRLRGPAVSAQEIVPADGAQLTVTPERLAWPAQVGATGYQVRLYDESAEILWQGPEVQQPKSVLPAVVSRTLEPGGAYFWTVRVRGEVTRQRLGPFWFLIRE